MHDERDRQRRACNHHRAAGERSGPPLREATVEERRAANEREQHRRRRDADEHQHRKRNRRRHAESPARAACPSGVAEGGRTSVTG